MKNLLLLFCITLSINAVNSQSTQDRLLGKWNLIRISGGITGNGFPIKKRTVIEFTTDFKYKSYIQDTLKATRTYAVLRDILTHYRIDGIDILQIDQRFSGKYELFFSKNRLVLREPYPDGFTRVYQRVPLGSFNK